jgi:hypothetical protein
MWALLREPAGLVWSSLHKAAGVASSALPVVYRAAITLRAYEETGDFASAIKAYDDARKSPRARPPPTGYSSSGTGWARCSSWRSASAGSSCPRRSSRGAANAFAGTIFSQRSISSSNNRSFLSA